MEIEKLIDAFAAATNIGPTAPVDGVWKFSADDHVFGVTADDAGETVFIFGEIPAPPPNRVDAFRKTALEANFFGRGTSGAVFSINPENGAYTLVRSERLDRLVPESFFTLVEKFVNTLATWKGIVAAAQTQTETEAEPETTAEPREGSPEFPVDPLALGFMRI